MWALGILLYQLVNSMKHPFESENVFAMIDKIKEKKPLLLPEAASPFIKQLISMLLDKNPMNRPDAASLLLNDKIHEYAKNIAC